MSDKHWDSVMDYIGTPKLELGPAFAYQALETPRHLVFVFSRYKFVAKMLSSKKNARVLEMGCGEGVGSLILAEDGHSIVGVDFDEGQIAYAKKHLENHSKFDISFLHGDLLDMNLGKFDAVVNLDVIEHIPTEEEEIFVKTMSDHMKDDGFCLVGTPNISAHKYASEMSKRGHINLYDAERLQNLLLKFFKNAFIFGMNDEVVHTGFQPMCHYLMVLACGKK
jgi:2-polyprenyl-3-methyl-5-hydroxy-6-metoxy-1,4-benzoquinol methylase